MNYKVCILAAGPSRRIGDVSDHVHKAILPVNNKAVISYIIEKFPVEVEVVIAVGHRKQTIIDYLTLAYPDRHFRFVEIERYFGEGTGPGRSLLECRDYLQCPFVLAAADTIVLEPIPPPDRNWFGIAPVAPELTGRYCTVRTDGPQILRIDDKVPTDNREAFIGLAGVCDYAGFFLALEANQEAISGEIQVSNGFQALLGQGLNAERFTWFDTGTFEGFEQANKHFSPEGAFDFSKEDEFLYFVNGKVVKFFASPEVVRQRVERVPYLNGLCPALTGSTSHFYAYDFVPGRVVYEQFDGALTREFLDWAYGKLWQPLQLPASEQDAFETACMRFYRDKTMQRLQRFYDRTGRVDGPVTVNGVAVPPLRDALERMDWGWLSSGVPSRFHGDLHFDNTLRTPTGFVLVDWRQDFAGLTAYGDMYYDLAKLYGGFIINYRLIKKNLFRCEAHGADVTYDLQLTPEMEEAQQVVAAWVAERGLDFRKVRTITALIFLNMSPLHQPPFDILLYHLGQRMLHEVLGDGKQPAEADVRPLLCVGPMSREIVDTVISFSHARGVPLCLIASRSQVETEALGGGYANNWTTEDFAAYVRDRLKETSADVLMCRDHGGPWLGADEAALAEKHAMMAAKASLEADIASGFKMLHIDTSVDPAGFDVETALRRAFELLVFCEGKARQYGASVSYEIGTEDADGGIAEPGVFEHYLSSIVAFCEKQRISKPRFIVARTGTWVREARQVGTFHPANTTRLLEIARRYGVGIKEHNADYDSADNYRLRGKIGVTALNVAPELGVLQTRTVLEVCRRKGRQDLSDRFIDLAYNSKKWRKWLQRPDRTTKEEKAIIAGHYVFGTEEFRQICAELAPDLEPTIRRVIWSKLDWYVRNLHGDGASEVGRVLDAATA